MSALPRKRHVWFVPKADIQPRTLNTNDFEPPGASSVSGARGGRPSTKSDPSQRKIRIFFKLAAGLAAISRQLSSHADALPPAFFVGDRSSKRRHRMIAAEVIRKFATDVDEPVGRTPEGFLRPLHGSTQGDATPSRSPRDCKTRSPIAKRFLAAT